MTKIMTSRQILALVVVYSLGVAAPVRAGALEDANAAFREAEFEMALGILKTRLDARGLAARERREALSLAAQCHARLDQEDAAVERMCEALDAEPRWQPDPTVFSPAEMRLFRVALATCPPDIPDEPEPPPLGIEPMGEAGSKWYANKLVWAGAGVAALATVLLLGGDDSGAPGGGDTGAPDFPDPPSGALAR